MTENAPLGRLLGMALQGSAPYGAGLLGNPIASRGLAGLLGTQSFAQRMAAMPQPTPADTARGMLSADFGRGITADDPRAELAMALSTATPRAGIRAYHGSPHDFDRFDMSRIGTGEGAQAYGHGLYFAGNEGVARSYRDTLSPINVNVRADGAPISLDMQRMIGDSWHTLQGRTLRQPGIRDALDLVDDALMRQRADAMRARDMDWFNRIEDLRVEARRVRDTPPQPSGRMYEVNLRTDPSRLLDWDAPLASQAPAVQDGIRNAIMEGARRPAPMDGLRSWERALISGEQNGRPLFGHDAYRHLSRRLGTAENGQWLNNDPAAAASLLRNTGIPGIQYLDQGSRSAGQGTRNYVMFDDNLIEIIRKYGIAGLLGSGAGYGMLSPTQAPQNP